MGKGEPFYLFIYFRSIEAHDYSILDYRDHSILCFDIDHMMLLR
jgi:hypothetical protein